MSTIEKRDEAIDLARYKQAAEEIETGNRDDALWYKAFADGGGDENATKAAYIRLRVEQLRRAAVAASAVCVTATQPSPTYTPATPTAKPKSNGAKSLSDRDLYVAYLGEKNQAYYLEKFERFDRLGDGIHISWNWPACITFLFGATWWALYRKLYAWFFALFILGAVILGLTPKHIPEAAFVIGVVPATAIGMFANVIYYRRVKAKIFAAQSIARSDDELIELLIKKGGIHSWVWWILWVWLVVAVVGIIAAIAIPAYSDYTKKAKAQASGNVPQAAQELTIPDRQGVSYDQNDPPFKEANSLLAAGKYAEAIEIWRPLAEKGNARAQYAMGHSYQTGRGVLKDYAEASKWFLLSAEQGDARAHVSIGLNYSEGQGVTQSYQEAVKWYRSAAEQGNVRGQALLGIAYAQGEGVIQDQQEAVKWFHLAAKQGDASAQNVLGGCYDIGDGVPRNSIKAHMWYSIAAAIGDKKIATSASASRDLLERVVLSPNDITRSQQMARECMNSNYENCD